MSKKEVRWPQGESFQFIIDGHPSDHKEFPSKPYQNICKGSLDNSLQFIWEITFGGLHAYF
jgi:hypothetical protein